MENIDLMLAVNTSPGLRRYWETLRALLRIRRVFKPDLYILGFRGHEVALLVRRICAGKPLVFDAMMSPYAALVEESKFGVLGKFLGRAWRRFEGAALQQANLVLTDTELHGHYYQSQFGISAQKLLALPVGADEAGQVVPRTFSDLPDSQFRVLFYGSFLPLHGIDVIIDAASRLTNLPIIFNFIGGTKAQVRHLCAACTARGIRYTHRTWVPFDELLSEDIAQADLCLGGPFGGTPQASRVVTGKTSQCLALAKATVIGCIDENFGFLDKVNCLLVPQRDAVRLADAIQWAHDHRFMLEEIGLRGQAQYRKHLSVAVIEARLRPALERLIAG